MRLREIGELKLLKAIRKRFSSGQQAIGSGIILGIGDDAAVLAPHNKKILVTTDMMNEGVHFDLGFTAPFHLGFKLVSVNVSDIMAMGGKPEYLFLNISMKKDADEDFFNRLYDGISSAMDVYGIRLAGGDLSSAINDMVLSATVIGYGNKIVTRSGAKVGDKIYLTGTPGESACGLEILKRATTNSRKWIRNSEFRIQNPVGKYRSNIKITHNSKIITLDFEAVKPLLARHLMPVARDYKQLSINATSMIDVSDGLFIDLNRICDESNVGARVYLDRIPLSDEMKYASERMDLGPLSLATSGGEDYELLFTTAAEAVSSQRSAVSDKKRKGLTRQSSPVEVTCIGEITKKKRVVVDMSGRESVMKVEGYQHFGSAR